LLIFFLSPFPSPNYIQKSCKMNRVNGTLLLINFAQHAVWSIRQIIWDTWFTNIFKYHTFPLREFFRLSPAQMVINNWSVIEISWWLMLWREAISACKNSEIRKSETERERKKNVGFEKICKKRGSGKGKK
jgi:hypothetical protein